MSIKIPETPAVEIGKELSLNQLIEWFKFASEDIDLDSYINSNVLNVLNEYKMDSESTWSNGKYYLYGQIPIYSDEAITQNILQSALNASIERFQEYGGPCNSFEAASIAINEKRFTNLLILIEFYYNKYKEMAFDIKGS